MAKVYTNKIFSVEERRVKKEGKDFISYGVRYPEYVVILPFLNRETILLEWQYRPVIKKYIYELPAGKMDHGIGALETAKRELHEETGYVARRMRPLFKSYPMPGTVTTTSYSFYATGLTKKKRHLDNDEIIDVQEVSFDKALRMIRTNQIMDMKSIATILYYVNNSQQNLDSYRHK